VQRNQDWVFLGFTVLISEKKKQSGQVPYIFDADGGN
jgi:hypothetical protein